MSAALIPVEPDVLTRLFALRQADSDSVNDVLRRIFPAAAKPSVTSAEPAFPATPHVNDGSVPWELLGEKHVESDAKDALVNILGDCAQYDDDFFPKLAAKVRGRTRNHIARSRWEVYPGRPDLARNAKELGGGWFIGCNISNREKEKILRAACDVMGLTFGRDLKIDLPNT